MVRAAEVARLGDAAQVAFHQRDAGALHGDVGAGAHGDADIGLRQRRGVVDAVAGHGHDAPFRLQPLDHLALLLRQHFGLDLVDAELARHGVRGRAAVAGEHDDAHAVRRAAARIASGVDGLIGSATPSRAGGASDRWHTNITVWPSRAQLLRAREQIRCRHAELLRAAPIADRHGVSVDRAA